MNDQAIFIYNMGGVGESNQPVSNVTLFRIEIIRVSLFGNEAFFFLLLRSSFAFFLVSPPLLYCTKYNNCSSIYLFNQYIEIRDEHCSIQSINTIYQYNQHQHQHQYQSLVTLTTINTIQYNTMSNVHGLFSNRDNNDSDDNDSSNNRYVGGVSARGGGRCVLCYSSIVVCFHLSYHNNLTPTPTPPPS